MRGLPMPLALDGDASRWVRELADRALAAALEAYTRPAPEGSQQPFCPPAPAWQPSVFVLAGVAAALLGGALLVLGLVLCRCAWRALQHVNSGEPHPADGKKNGGDAPKSAGCRTLV